MALKGGPGAAVPIVYLGPTWLGPTSDLLSGTHSPPGDSDAH